MLYAGCKRWFTLIMSWLMLAAPAVAQQISLAGTWRFAIDREDKGAGDQWYRKVLSDSVRLPGSMKENGKGDEVTLQTKWTGSIYDSSFFFRPSLAKYRTKENLKIPFWLTPVKHYTGLAWYQKEVVVPGEWKEKNVRIFLERVHIRSVLWIDDQPVGTENSLTTPHVFDLGKLSPGKHRITICIDNRIKDMNVGPDSHSVTDQTQGNWNGIIGKMYLEAYPDQHITDVQVFPDIRKKEATIRVRVANKGQATTNVLVTASAESFNTNILQQTQEVFERANVGVGDTSLVTMTLPMTDDMVLWDEFNPAQYRLTVQVKSGSTTDTKKVAFAMREIRIEGTRFYINDRPVFLRGTVNNCEFPLTGYPAMDVPSWERIFRIAREHGLNHMCFHSWCPPEAAFVAADKLGFYLQPEGPTWANHGTSLGDGRFIDQYLMDETKRMATVYGNHASFCMLSSGNEPAGRNQLAYLTAFVDYWKANDQRRVYTGACVGMNWPLVPDNQYMVKSGPRGLKWTNREPEGNLDYYDAIKDFTVPYVTHEMGQWCVFPDFDEIKKYTGSFRAKNFELFRQDLADHGMADEAKDFLMASGKLQVLCYKAEIEKSLRTPGLGGFQLLGITDFPGQGTALVGVLDAFWDSKPYVTATEFRRFCNATVLLARLPQFVYADSAVLQAPVELFNFGNVALDHMTVSWSLVDDGGDTIKTGRFAPQDFGRGQNLPVGVVSVSLRDIPAPAHYKLVLQMETMPVANDWDIWVYPANLPKLKDDGVYYCTEFDAKAEAVLEQGGKVFLNAAGKIVKGKEVQMYFTPVFWNTSWFKMRPPHVTGMLIRDKHPMFEAFPTSYHTDYQWWSIIHGAQVMHLEDFPPGFRPTVQPIDTWFMNRRLALIFEAKVGKGKMIVSGANLSDTASGLASRQLYHSIRSYMESDRFAPVDQIDPALIRDLMQTPSRETWDSFTRANPDELQPSKTKRKNNK